MQSLSDKFLKNLVLVLAIVGASKAHSFDYFDKKIDYWNNNQEQAPEPTNNPQSKSEAKADPSFDWKKALDPMDDSLEFFREGEYLPPKPYIEMFRNPNDENIKNWFALMQKKNELAAALQQRMQEYVRKNQIPQPLASEYTQTSNDLVTPAPPINPEQYRLRLYFHSKCPHCKRMMATLQELSAQGFFIEIRQIDEDRAALGSVPFPVARASEQELREKEISSWPVLLIADLKSKVIYRINGYQNANSIIETLRRTP